ncbi:acetylcholinesterase-like isoform X2 [Ornithodoros turicata]|uniref:acetylcholinesterase-like isoform X2 n=1 Tax=Ornithodoros turicata TaxID=34597 RepID=UPI0031398AF3
MSKNQGAVEDEIRPTRSPQQSTGPVSDTKSIERLVESDLSDNLPGDLPFFEYACASCCGVTVLALVIFIIYLAINSMAFHQLSFSPKVRTRTGLTQGVRLSVGSDTVFAFYAVPYAEPPLQSARFQLPTPVRFWPGQLEATSKAAPCVQQPLSRKPANLTPDFTEDCLHLNIWTPGLDGKKLHPVVVVLHGGGFTQGSNSLDQYDGAQFSKRTGSVVVVPNYRLGVFGFLFGNISAIPGNQGLWDQQQVLHWVVENIDSFGGDPNLMTLWGVEAGAVCAGLHLLSKRSRPLFHRVVLQGGSPFSRLGDNYYSGPDKVDALARAICGRPLSSNASQVLSCLQNALPTQLVSVPVQDAFRRTLSPYIPTFGDSLFPDDPLTVLSKGRLPRTDLLLGFTSNEGANLFRVFLEQTYGEPWMTLSSEKYREAASALLTFLFGVDVLEAENLHSGLAFPKDNREGRVFIYEYGLVEDPDDWLGVPENIDFQLAFGTASNVTVAAVHSLRLQEALASFVQLGIVDWLPYTLNDSQVMHFQDKSSTVTKTKLAIQCDIYYKYHATS